MIFFPLSRDVERLVRLGFVSFKLCACQGLALLLCSQLQLDLSLALLFPLLYIHFDFPMVSAPGIALNSEGVPRTYLKTRCMWVCVDVHGMSVCHSARIGVRELVHLGSLFPLGWNSGCWALAKSLPAEPSCWPRSSTIRLDWHTPCKAGSFTACENKAGVMWKSVSNSTRGKPWQYDDWVWETAQCPCE